MPINRDHSFTWPMEYWYLDPKITMCKYKYTPIGTLMLTFKSVFFSAISHQMGLFGSKSGCLTPGRSCIGVLPIVWDSFWMNTLMTCCKCYNGDYLYLLIVNIWELLAKYCYFWVEIHGFGPWVVNYRNTPCSLWTNFKEHYHALFFCRFSRNGLTWGDINDTSIFFGTFVSKYRNFTPWGCHM